MQTGLMLFNLSRILLIMIKECIQNMNTINCCVNACRSLFFTQLIDAHVSVATR